MLSKIKLQTDIYECVWVYVNIMHPPLLCSILHNYMISYAFLNSFYFFPTIFDIFPPLIPDMSFLTHATFNRCVRFTISINPNYHTMRLILLSFRFHRWRPWVTKKLSSLPKITFPRFSSESLAHVLHLQP